MPHRTLIRDASVVMPEETARTSVLIEDGTIADVDPPRHARADEIVDAAGLHLLPGVIDDQVHFRDPGLTHKEDLRTGSMACAAGGVTSFLEMPNTVPQTVTVRALREKLERAARRSVVNYGFYAGATTGNLAELRRIERTRNLPTPGIKIFIGSSTGEMLVDDQESLEAIFAETVLPIAAHCEDETTVRANRQRIGSPPTIRDHSRIRDRWAALTATLRAIDLADRHRHRFHLLHASTAEEVAILACRLLEKRELVTAEVCPHHLFFDTSDYDRLGSLAQMNPSLKEAGDRKALWRGLKAGAIQILATDHAPHTLEEKRLPYPESPSGVPAVELVLPLMLNEANRGRCTLEDIAAWTSDGPARVWDIVGKGRIEPGGDADLVLVDMAEERVVRNEDQWSKCGWTPWHGTRLQGWPVRTWVGGRTVFANGKVEMEPCGGRLEFDRERGGYWAESAGSIVPASG